MPIDASEVWLRAKPFLLGNVGTASQLYIFDIPIAALDSVIDAFVRFVKDPLVIVFNNYAGEPTPLDDALRAAILSHADALHRIDGLHNGREVVSMWLEPGPHAFDVDFVFWADQLFPHPDDESACFYTFQEYVALAESIRSLSPASESAITAAESHPRGDRGKPWTFFW